tara:strand:+ start:420 stop:653 length:234 start_codon:yes stop_codon:yes gene_type:complete
MTNQTQTIGNKEVTVRFLNDDNSGFLDMLDIDFVNVFRRMKGDFNFGIEVRDFGYLNNNQYTTLTNKQLHNKFIFVN